MDTKFIFIKSYAFSSKVEFLPFHLLKDFQELLHEPDELSSEIILILQHIVFSDNVHMSYTGRQLTTIFGTP